MGDVTRLESELTELERLRGYFAAGLTTEHVRATYPAAAALAVHWNPKQTLAGATPSVVLDDNGTTLGDFPTDNDGDWPGARTTALSLNGHSPGLAPAAHQAVPGFAPATHTLNLDQALADPPPLPSASHLRACPQPESRPTGTPNRKLSSRTHQRVTNVQPSCN